VQSEGENLGELRYPFQALAGTALCAGRDFGEYLLGALREEDFHRLF
jgi:hypothetical protein